MGDDNDTLDQGGEILHLVKGGKDTSKPQDSCEEALQGLEEVREQIVSGRLTSMILFSVTADGRYTRLILSKNRFEIIGLANDLYAVVKEDLVYKSEN